MNMTESAAAGPTSKCSAVEEIHSATQVIQLALKSLQDPHASVRLDEIASVFRQVQHTHELIPRVRENSDPEFVHALYEYRSALGDWSEQLPRLRGRLLTEKSRLESRRAHANAVADRLRAQTHSR